jgi:hypothetical protein
MHPKTKMVANKMHMFLLCECHFGFNIIRVTQNHLIFFVLWKEMKLYYGVQSNSAISLILITVLDIINSPLNNYRAADFFL